MPVQLFSIAYLGLLMDSEWSTTIAAQVSVLSSTVYQRGFGVHQWDISVARLNSLLAKVNDTRERLHFSHSPNVEISRKSVLMLYSGDRSCSLPNWPFCYSSGAYSIRLAP